MKKKKKLKKLFVIIPVAVVLIAGIIVGLMIARKNSEKAYVMPVSENNNSWIVSMASYSGTVAESAQDNIQASGEDPVTEVFVKEGDQVKKGDKLFQYDAESLQIKVEEKQLSANYCQTLLDRQQKLLETYQNIVPYIPPETEEIIETAPDEEADTSEDQAVEEQPVEEEPQEASTEKTCTPQEKADAITDQQLEVSKAKTALEKANEELKEAQKALENATVYAKIDGTVTKIGSPGIYTNASAPFCTIIGDTGVTVKGYLGEFDLKSLSVGDTLSVVSNMTGESSEAEILSINDYPTDNADTYYGSGNPNTSFYEFSAFIAESEGFDIGENVQITKQAEDFDSLIVLDQIFVRTDEKGSYVLKDQDGKLARQDVKTEKTSESQYLIITEGLTLDDMIAFPYGPLAKEGLLTTTEQKTGLF